MGYLLFKRKRIIIMSSINEITGDKIQTKGVTTDAYRDSWDRIFGKKKEPCVCTQWTLGCCGESPKEEKPKESTGCCGECC
jgi:hypothetical protein